MLFYAEQQLEFNVSTKQTGLPVNVSRPTRTIFVMQSLPQIDIVNLFLCVYIWNPLVNTVGKYPCN